MVNQFKVVDAHCHIYPEKIAKRATAGTDSFYDGEHSACLGTAQDLVLRGSDAGTDIFVVQSVATTPAQVSHINRFIAQEEALSNGRFIGLGTLHPDSENVESDFNEIMLLGLHGVKLHPDIQRFAIDDKKCFTIYSLCENAGLPILMHTGDKRFDYSNPDRLLPILREFPRLIIVGAHLGGWSVWAEAREKLAGFENLYVDSSSCLPFTSDDEVRKSIDAFGTDRVLYGTDYPMWAPEKEIEHFLSLGYSDSQYSAMLSGNAEKVFI